MPTERTAEVKEPSPKPNSKGKSSWTSRFRRKTDEHQHEKKKQLQDYTAWVNNYLKRKPGIPMVTDLRSNLQDGITFINLIEIVAHTQLDGIDRQPSNSHSRRSNVEKVIEFLRKEGISFQGDPAKDIIDGNSKAIMRVILAVAERYQPRSVKQRTGIDPKLFTPPNPKDLDKDHMTYSLQTDRNVLKRSQSPEGNIRGLNRSSVTTNSISVPNMACINVHTGGGASDKVGGARSGSGYRYSVTNNCTTPTIPVHGRSSGYPVSSSGQRVPSQPDRPLQFPDRLDRLSEIPRGSYIKPQGDFERDDTYATPADTLPPSVGTRIIPPMKKTGQNTQSRHRPLPINIRSIPDDHVRPMALSSPVGSSPQQDIGLHHDEMSTVLSELTEFKAGLLHLHTLLLANSDGSSIGKNLTSQLPKEREEGRATEDDSTSTPTAKDAPLDILSAMNALTLEDRARDLEKTNEVVSLQRQLSQLHDEFTQMESECVTLRNMLEERNTFITTMKSEVYRKEYKNDTHRVEMQNIIKQKEAFVKKLEEELSAVKETYELKVDELSNQLQEQIKAENGLRVEFESLQTEVTRLTETEDVLQGKVANRERKISHLEDKMADLQDSRSKKVTEDADSIREGLVQLRASVSPQDPQQQIIDALEQKISEMMGRAIDRSGSPLGKRSRKHRDLEDHHRDRERRKRHREKHHSAILSGVEPKAEGAPPTSAGGCVSGDITKVFYYMLSDKTDTPYVTLVPGKSNEITLRDFKSVFDRVGTFRFYFKTEDPDCGIVKEEITGDDKILPNWKGKILVWISEKGHTR